MKKALHRFGKYYSKIIVNNIGIFIFVGILFVVFGDCGWFPNRNIYAISQFVYKVVIPIMIAYEGGNQIAKTVGKAADRNLQMGGAIAVMATSGMILASEQIGILAAMILGPVCGMLWQTIYKLISDKIKTGLEMLIRNLTAAVVGCIMAVVSFYFIAPMLSVFTDILMEIVNYIIEHKLIWLSSLIIEPSKVFFLNNSINHGILVPLGIQQAKQTGESILFLLETNPGPGLGILLALYLKSKNNKQKKEKYASFMFVHFIGGLHEIYFPEVLANLWLLPSLIVGSIIGNICFIIFNAAATGVISPGSIFTVCLMCVPGKMIFAIIGVFISAIVSATLAFFTLTLQEKNGAKDNTSGNNIDVSKVKEIEHLENKMIRKIGFVCNAGVGSSSMGAALFRRKLREAGLKELEVNAYAADQIPADLDLIICQKDLKELMLQDIKDEYVYTVDNLLNQSEYMTVIEKIQKTGGVL